MTKKEREERSKPIQFYCSDREYNEIEEFSKQAGTTKSEFIRQAISDKILRMKNPEMFDSKGINDVSKSQIKAMLETTTENQEKIDLMLEKMNLIIENQKAFEIISKRVNKNELVEIEKAIEILLTSHKSLKLEELTSMLQYDEDAILKTLSIKDDNNKPKYTMDMKSGGFKRNV